MNKSKNNSSKYIGSVNDWVVFFENLSKILNESHDLRVVVDDDYDREYIFQSIHQKENDLKITLPKSYTDFILANGLVFFNLFYKKISSGAINTEYKILDLNNIDFYKNLYIDEFNGWTRYAQNNTNDWSYYNYNGNLRSQCSYNVEDFHNLIIVGEISDCEKLALNLGCSSIDGEYESWELSPKFPGIYRDRCFAETFIMTWVIDLMENIYPQLYENMTIVECVKLFRVDTLLSMNEIYLE